MTVLLDIAALLALALALAFVPLMGHRTDLRITREIRAAERGGGREHPLEQAPRTRGERHARY
jgi:hypothetical protein